MERDSNNCAMRGQRGPVGPIGWWHTLVELWDRRIFAVPLIAATRRGTSQSVVRRMPIAVRSYEALQEEYSSLPSGAVPKNPPVHSRAPMPPSRMRLTVLGKCRNWGVDRNPANLLFAERPYFLSSHQTRNGSGRNNSTDDGWKNVAFNLINSLNREQRTINRFAPFGRLGRKTPR